MTGTRRAAGFLLLAACGHPARPTASPTNHTGTTAADIALRADRALREDSPIDYTRPFANKPPDRSVAIGLYLDACHGGDYRSCWMARALVPEAQQVTLLAPIATNCRAGDLMSCRALPRDDDDDAPRFPDLPGALGRDCVSDDCDLAALQAECVAGFPKSCHRRQGKTRGIPNKDLPNATRRHELSAVGCTAGIVDECPEAELSGAHAVKLAAYQQHCFLDRDSCRDLGDILDEIALNQTGHYSIEARDAYERGCQYATDLEACYELGSNYLGQSYPEPVKGRGAALLGYVCEQFAKTEPPDVFLRKRSLCKFGKKP